MRTADGSDPRRACAAAGLIVLAGAACYANSLTGEFVFDDLDAVVGNASIRSPDTVWVPPPNTTASGRPLLNLSLALNYAAGGYDVRGYHVANVALHLAAAVALYALVRGTLLRARVPEPFRRRATAIGLAVGLVWAVHPLQTEVAAYVVQRGEALAALCCFMSLWCLLRSAEWSERAARWYAPAGRRPALVGRYVTARERANRFSGAAVATALLGVLSKETTAALPVVAVLYDRAVLSGSFREALRQRGRTHAGLFASWLLLGWLVAATGGRGGTVGASDGSPIRYAAAQAMWILHYLRLCAWPDPLVFDYGFAVEPWGARLRTSGAIVLVLVGAAAGACAIRPAAGFLPVAFFAALAPSSSFVPVVTQVAAERRMYLPLAALVTLAVLICVKLVLAATGRVGVRRTVLVALLAACAVPLGVRTHLRNRDYRTGERLWAATVAQVPDNPRARTNLARALLERGRVDDAIVHLRAASALTPSDPRPHNALGFALLHHGRVPEAIVSFRAVVRLDPNSAEARANLATALHAGGELNEAVVWYGRAIEVRPDGAEAHFGLGQALRAAGRPDEATAALRRAGALDPKYAGRGAPP